MGIKITVDKASELAYIKHVLEIGHLNIDKDFHKKIIEVYGVDSEFSKTVRANHDKVKYDFKFEKSENFIDDLNMINKEDKKVSKKVVMISQPMKGHTEEQIKVIRTRAEKYLTTAGYVIRDTYFEDEWANPENMTARGVHNIPVAFLGKSIEGMSYCDAVYFCKGWEHARGCKIEHTIAQEYGLEIIYEDPNALYVKLMETQKQFDEVKMDLLKKIESYEA